MRTLLVAAAMMLFTGCYAHYPHRGYYGWHHHHYRHW
jgi:hypothetical protein